MSLGKKYFDSFSVGFSLFSFLQMICSLYVIWNIMLFISRQLNRKILVVTMVFLLANTSYIGFNVSTRFFVFCMLYDGYAVNFDEFYK